MNRRQADRKLRLELLRARAAADRLDLSMAVKDISDRLVPLRRAADAVESIAGALSGRGRALGWLVAALAAVTRVRGIRRALAGGAPGVGRMALGALVAGAVALLMRRWRGSEEEQPDSRTGGGDETAGGH